MTLRQVMHTHIPTLNPRSTVRDAVDKMDIYQFPALVVVNEDLIPLAVVTEGDICRAAANEDSVTSLANLPVMSFGTANPSTLPLDLEIGEAFHRMLSSHLTIVPVMDGPYMSGIVLRVDLMQALMMDSR
jgi:CBS domain-containing protein